MIYASELTVFPSTPLSEDIINKKFEEATEIERIEEMQEFIRCLTIETTFRAEHVTITVPVSGKVPQDTERMISELQKVIDQGENENRLQNYRKHITSL